jgi:hypothetical protein
MSSMATLSGPGSGSVSHWSRIEEGEQESRRNSKKYRQREGIFVRTEEEPGNNYGLGYVIIDNLLSSRHLSYRSALRPRSRLSTHANHSARHQHS